MLSCIYSTGGGRASLAQWRRECFARGRVQATLDQAKAFPKSQARAVSGGVLQTCSRVGCFEDCGAQSAQKKAIWRETQVETLVRMIAQAYVLPFGQ